MTDIDKKALVLELRQLAKAIEMGRTVAQEKPLIGQIATRLLDAVNAGTLAKTMVAGFFK